MRRTRADKSLQNSSDKLFTDRDSNSQHETRTVADNLLKDFYLDKKIAQ